MSWPRTPRQRALGALGRLASCAALALALGCGGSSRDLAAGVRLTELLDPARPPGAPAECGVGGEIRPALGCLAPVQIAPPPLAALEREMLPVEIPVPEALRSQRAVIDVRVRGPLGELMIDGMAAAVPPGTPSLRGALRVPLDTPLPAKSHLSATGVALPAAHQHFATQRRGDRKWIFQSNREGAREMYDLSTDPGEHHSLEDADLARAGAPLQEEHRAMSVAAQHARGTAGRAGEATRDGGATVPANLDEDTASKLRALGYLD